MKTLYICNAIGFTISTLVCSHLHDYEPAKILAILAVCFAILSKGEK